RDAGADAHYSEADCVGEDHARAGDGGVLVLSRVQSAEPLISAVHWKSGAGPSGKRTRYPSSSRPCSNIVGADIPIFSHSGSWRLPRRCSIRLKQLMAPN